MKTFERDPFTWRYPAVEPFNSGFLTVSNLHTVYYEESGNPKGRPIVFVHGGPGGGTEPKHRQFFSPDLYRIILFDQRGCGKSTPFASLEENTTWDLVSDMEKIRTHLGLEKWHVFGGSWGSTLSLAYAQKHSERVSALILRGIFLLRKREIDWFYQDGASRIFPDAWEPYEKAIPLKERNDYLTAYHKRLTSSDEKVRAEACKAWSVWEGSVSKLYPDASFIDHYSQPDFALAFARIECHYFVNKGFLKSDDQLLQDVSKIRHVPGVIVQGRYDVVCPMDSAWALHRAWPEAELVTVWDAGHAAGEPSLCRALIAATDRFAHL
ncbi:MAG: prolyl aminopeptidase [Deltaproteobacteria bacterium]|nr:prolyl aminopeptidase [Deltaproteobacteria bacterium]MBI3294730.1 prolyl aminopeptidase [Deltaproteobacteria bacterium]